MLCMLRYHTSVRPLVLVLQMGVRIMIIVIMITFVWRKTHAALHTIAFSICLWISDRIEYVTITIKYILQAALLVYDDLIVNCRLQLQLASWSTHCLVEYLIELKVLNWSITQIDGTVSLTRTVSYASFDRFFQRK